MFQLKVALPVAICSVMLIALPVPTSPQGTDHELLVRLFDSETGFPVPVPVLHSNMAFVETEAHRAGEILLNAVKERGVLTLSAPGYPELRLTLGAAAATPAIQVYLPPQQVPHQFENTQLQELVNATSAGIAGFLSADDSGRPLEGVRIGVEETPYQTLSDAAGFFKLALPVPEKADRITARISFSKAGYTTVVRSNVDLYAGTVQKYRIRLLPGSGTSVIDEQQLRGIGTGAIFEKPFETLSHDHFNGLALPATVRVGTQCGNDPKGCTTVVVNTLEDYAKHVLPREWMPSWHTESLKAGSVAVRGYGAWYTEHPLTARYDICDYQACQMYDPTSTNNRTDAAVDATKGAVLADQSGAIARSEYAAENNNAGCGDGKTGTGQPIAPCLSDVTCKGTTKNGHGRGMCQWGSQRWASGKDHDGNPVAGGSETYDWILKHYYPSYTIKIGATEFLSAIQ
jgi:Stage II sporulation protein/Carboxypeptidase regulatory-like domain